MATARTTRLGIVTAAGLALAALAQTAAAVTIDFRNAGGGAGGFGNSLTFQAGDLSLTATAWAETGAQSPSGSGWFLFETAEIWSWDSGLAVCNRAEGATSSGCDVTTHEVDTVGQDDLLVLFFNRTVDFQALTLNPHNAGMNDPNDRDIAYWVGNVAGPPDLSGWTFDTLEQMPGLAAPLVNSVDSSYSWYTHTLSGRGNLLLVSGNFRERNCMNKNGSAPEECEAWKLRNLTVEVAPRIVPQVVPLPGAAWLFGPAVGALAWLRRRPGRA